MNYRFNADDYYYEIVKAGQVVAKTTTEAEAKTIVKKGEL